MPGRPSTAPTPSGRLGRRPLPARALGVWLRTAGRPDRFVDRIDVATDRHGEVDGSVVVASDPGDHDVVLITREPDRSPVAHGPVVLSGRLSR